MHRYKIRPMHTSENLLIEFFSGPEDASFREAIAEAMAPLGFKAEFDGHYFYVQHPDQNSALKGISISSDEWGVIWGDADAWSTKENNHKLISVFSEILSGSNKFIKVS